MSLLSNLVQKPYLGLTRSGAQLAYQVSDATVLVESTDTLVAGQALPTMTYKNGYQSAGSSISHIHQFKNAAAAIINFATLAASAQVITAAAESGRLTATVYAAGTPIAIGFDGANAAWMPITDATAALGVAANRWTSLYLGTGATSLQILTGGAFGQINAVAANGLQLQVGGVEQLRLVGKRVSLLASVAADGELVTTGAAAHPATGNTARGFVSSFITPAAATAEASQFYAAPQTSAAAFTAAQVSGLLVADAVKGAGSAITALAGVRVNDLTQGVNNYGFFGNVALGANKYNLYMPGTAVNFMAGALGLGVAPGGTNALEATSSQAAGGGHSFAMTSVVYTGTVLTHTVSTAAASTWYHAKFTTSTPATQFAVRGDGATTIGTATVQDTALLTVAGRVALPFNSTYDLVGGFWSAAAAIHSSTISVPANKTGVGLYLITDNNITLGAASQFYGIYCQSNVSTTNNNPTAAIAGQASDAGTGTSYGVYAVSLPQNGYTGSSYALSASIGSRSGAATQGMVLLNFTGPTNDAIVIDGSANLGDSLNFGVRITSNFKLNTCAFQYTQRAGQTAAFLKYIDSGATTRFQVDSNGDVTLGGTGRRIIADMDNGTRASRLSFQTSTVNAATSLGILPNGTSVTAALTAYGGSNADAAPQVQLVATSTQHAINSSNVGSATVGVGISIDSVYAMFVNTNKDITLAPAGAVTNMAAGFPYIPAAAGVPTGVPTVRAGYVPIYYDSTNNKLYAYNGAWKSVALI